jgi:hypothetical protein
MPLFAAQRLLQRETAGRQHCSYSSPSSRWVACARRAPIGSTKSGEGNMNWVGLHLRRPHRRVRVCAWACLAATRMVLADPAPDESRHCDAADPPAAKSLADVLYERREYQRAGECYQAAGDPSRAQLAFLKAVAPQSEATARAFREQQDAAKSLLTKVQQAFHSDH